MCGQLGREGCLTSVFDGCVFQNHKYFQGDTNKLCIQLYTDELEVCDPLGAKRGKHKLVVFYYSVLNVPSEYRSLVSHIHLAIVAKDKLVQEYGLHRILEPLLKDVAVLETEGITVKSKKYTGSVLCLTGDNLSSHRVGGFATNFSHGRVCRFCMALHHQLAVKHSEEDFVLRTPEGHSYHLSMLQNGLPTLSLYGVKAPCALTFSGFEPTEHLPPDVMHDIHEGVLPSLLKGPQTSIFLQGFCFLMSQTGLFETHLQSLRTIYAADIFKSSAEGALSLFPPRQTKEERRRCGAGRHEPCPWWQCSSVTFLLGISNMSYVLFFVTNQ